ncbi:protein kinase domain-containing protein [Halorussus pelagicus]|uniref:protein kinase domain-containing protein n=1 Tax=Halorussus pelagicus TaxID=2505977 RepID=UPI000FFC4A9C|nr:HEAT repeat domain-containing protein [Halorussus pelagicus]
MAGRERDGSERAGDDRDEGDRAGTDQETGGSDRIERLRAEARERWGRSDDDVMAVAPDLDSADPEERAAAAWTLAELAAEDPDNSRRIPVESDLAPLLTDDDEWVRRGASWAVANVADQQPHRARAALSEVTESLGDGDPLVRENSVLAVSEVAREHPHAAEPALNRLAQLAREGDGLARRYAAETLRRLVTRLDENGFPETIEASSDVAALLSETGVVAVTDDEGDGPVRVGGAGDSSEEDERSSTPRRGTATTDDRGPPDHFPDPPEIVADRRDFERSEDLDSGPLTSAAKVRARTTNDGGQRVVVVFRMLRSDTGLNPADFEDAVRLWAAVDDHPHVAPVLARGPNPRPWVVTEVLDGGSLRDHVGSIGFEQAVWYADCVAAAVSQAHARGVVHGALRPNAVGFSRTLGAWPIPKVGEWAFGDLLAAVRDLPVPPAFAAPEHVAPERFGAPDSTTDVYQLGALCYALFAGRPPFVGDATEIVRQVRDKEPRPASEFTERLPQSIDDLLARALAKRKRARFETAADFRRELAVATRELSLSVEL